jgi:hypothetical protein
MSSAVEAKADQIAASTTIPTAGFNQETSAIPRAVPATRLKNEPPRGEAWRLIANFVLLVRRDLY